MAGAARGGRAAAGECLAVLEQVLVAGADRVEVVEDAAEVVLERGDGVGLAAGLEVVLDPDGGCWSIRRSIVLGIGRLRRRTRSKVALGGADDAPGRLVAGGGHQAAVEVVVEREEGGGCPPRARRRSARAARRRRRGSRGPAAAWSAASSTASRMNWASRTCWTSIRATKLPTIDVDQPFLGEQDQALADRRAADAEVGGQIALRHSRAGREVERHDPLAQHPVHERARR